MPIATTVRPTMNGARLPLGGWLRSSVSPKITQTSRAVPMTSSRNGPHQLWKYGAGNVAKMLNVVTDAGDPRTM
jgi:hypothetical protein